MGDVADGTSLLVWDAESSPPAHAGETVLWSSVTEVSSADVISLPLLVEREADVLRKRYLAWVHDVGQELLGGQSLVERLHLRPGFSYWWMTPLSEKCNFSKSPQIDNAIRLLAFEQWVGGKEVRRIILATAADGLAECLCNWCRNSGIEFERKRLPANTEVPPWHRRLLQFVPSSLQAIAWLAKYAFQRRPLKGLGIKAWRESTAKITFVSYSANLNPDSAKSGHFESHYWGSLPRIVCDSGLTSNWMHIYVADLVVPSLIAAKSIFDGFNSNEPRIRAHSMLDSFLRGGVLARSVRDWLMLRKHGKILPHALQISHSKQMDFGPLFREEWKRTFLGKEALQSLLYFNLVEEAISFLPKQDIGVYLQENQPWEMAFIHAWRVAGHGRLIGVPHSNVRYWDLRYCFDRRDYTQHTNYRLPLPDYIGVNGPAAMRVLKDGGCPTERLVSVEALRYLYLAQLPRIQRPVVVQNSTLRVLVLTDYDAGHTRKQIGLLAKTLELLPESVQITVKAHPTLPLSPADLPGRQTTLSNRPLSELLALSDVAYASSVTSAAVEAYSVGLSVAVLFDPASLNMSPLRGMDTVAFVYTPEQLACAILKSHDGRCGSDKRTEQFFTVDENLPRWRCVLGMPSANLASGKCELPTDSS